MSTVELTATVRDLKELQQMAEELQTEITTLQDTIKQEMTSRGVDEMSVDVFKYAGHPLQAVDSTPQHLNLHIKTSIPSIRKKPKQGDSALHKTRLSNLSRPKQDR